MVKAKIQKDLKGRLKERDELAVSVLRLLLAAIFNREKEKRYKLSKEKPDLTPEELEKESALTDEEVIEVISSEIKKRKEAILEFSAYAEAPKIGAEAGRKEKIESFINKEKKEAEILQRYLPEQLSQPEIEKLAKEVIEKVEAKELKDMGKVMAELMPKVKGRANGNQVSKIVKELLS